MSGSGTDSDPSMEDVLASIRRILTDDGEEEPIKVAGTDAAAESGPAWEPGADTAAAEAANPDVFDLDQSMIVEEPGQRAPAPRTEADDGSPLLDAGVAAATEESFGALRQLAGQRQVMVYPGGPTIEEIVRQELRPLLKAWLDEHLPLLVERLVRAEIDRLRP